MESIRLNRLPKELRSTAYECQHAANRQGVWDGDDKTLTYQEFNTGRSWSIKQWGYSRDSQFVRDAQEIQRYFAGTKPLPDEFEK